MPQPGPPLLFLEPCTFSPRFFLLNFITIALPLRNTEILGYHPGVLPLMLSTIFADCIVHDASFSSEASIGGLDAETQVMLLLEGTRPKSPEKP